MNMKKKSILFLIVMFFFFAMNLGYCQDDFFIDSNFKQSKSTSKMTQKMDEVASKAKKTTKDKFSFFKKKNKKEDEITSGYYGTLPEISRDFEYLNQKTNTTKEIDAIIPDDENEAEYKSAPYDDTLFLDVIVKKDKASTYVNDIQKTKHALSVLKKCIEENGNIQRFNAGVNVLDLQVKNLKTKYENKSESLKESYSEILLTNYYAKLLGNLKYDANYYSRYVPTMQGQYSEENVGKKEQELLNKINKTIFLINSEA